MIAKVKKGTGPAKIDFSDEGTKVIFDEGMQMYYYQPKVNLKDFTVKVVFNAPENTWNWGWYAITIGGNGRYTGAGGSQNFIVLFPRAEKSLRVNPQILHNGQGTIEPENKFFEQEYIGKELTIHSKAQLKIRHLAIQLPIQMLLILMMLILMMLQI